MPCRDFLAQLRRAAPEIEAMGARVVGVATGNASQAQHLIEQGVPFPLLLDPERTLYRTLGLEHIRWWRWVQPRTWRLFLRSAGRARQGRPSGDVRQTPGVAIIDTERRLRWLHRGTTLGDYPPLTGVLEALRSITGSPGGQAGFPRP